jgi:hypothetical protein
MEEVLRFRRAARLIVRDQMRDFRTRSLAIVELVAAARKEAALPQWCQEAIWRESAQFLATGEIPASPPSTDPVIGALRSLRRRHLVRCPTCERELPGDDTLARWEALRWAEFVELERAEATV